MRKGFLILTEGRSGSTWLGSLVTNAGLGNSGEWLDPIISGMNPHLRDRDTYFESVLDLATSGGAGFCVKIFPRHLHSMHRIYGVDFIRYCREKHDTSLVLLTRKDRLRQAISLSRSLQTTQWTSKRTEVREPEYDFSSICRSYFHINRSYDFWASYLALSGADCPSFVYEDLLPDPGHFLNHLADQLGQPRPEEMISDLRIQRDERTEIWLNRFIAEARDHDFLAESTPSRLPKRSFSNLIRFFRGRQQRPFPYVY